MSEYAMTRTVIVGGAEDCDCERLEGEHLLMWAALVAIAQDKCGEDALVEIASNALSRLSQERSADE